MKTVRWLLCLVLLVAVPGQGWARPAPPTSLPAPTGLRVMAPSGGAGSNRLQLHWDPVPGATGYEVYQLRGKKWWINEDDSNLTPLTCSTTIGGLEPAKAYEFAIKAVGEGGVKSPLGKSDGARTSSLEVNTPTFTQPTVVVGQTSLSKPLILEAPTGLFAVFSDQDRVRLAWRPVLNATRYEIEEQKHGVWKPAENIVGDISAVSVVLIDHVKPGPFVFRVIALGPKGAHSEPSWPVTASR